MKHIAIPPLAEIQQVLIHVFVFHIFLVLSRYLSGESSRFDGKLIALLVYPMRLLLFVRGGKVEGVDRGDGGELMVFFVLAG